MCIQVHGFDICSYLVDLLSLTGLKPETATSSQYQHWFSQYNFINLTII